MLCSPERSRSAVDGRAEGCSVRERSVALAWTRTLLVVLARILCMCRPAGAHVGITGRCHSGYGPPRRCGPPRIDYASECGPTSADTVRHSGYDSTIENTTLSREMTIVDVRSTPVHYRIWFFTHEN